MDKKDKITVEFLQDKSNEDIKNLQEERKEQLVALINLKASERTPEKAKELNEVRNEVDLLVDTYTGRLELENAKASADRAEVAARLQAMPANTPTTTVMDNAIDVMKNEIDEAYKNIESGAEKFEFKPTVNLLKNRVLNAVSTTTTGITPEPTSSMNILKPADSSILDMLTGIPVTSGSFKYRRETSSDTTGVKAEGAKAAAQDFLFADVTVALKNAAGFIEVSREQMDYSEGVAALVNSSLGGKVRRSAANSVVSDILAAVTGTQAQGVQVAQDDITYISLVMKKAYNGETQPNMLMAHPNTTLRIRLSKDGDDTFITNPLSGTRANVVLGDLALVPTFRMSELDFVVADSSQVPYAYYTGASTVRLEAGFKDSDFVNGIVTIRGSYPVAGLVLVEGSVAKGKFKAA